MNVRLPRLRDRLRFPAGNEKGETERLKRLHNVWRTSLEVRQEPQDTEISKGEQNQSRLWGCSTMLLPGGFRRKEVPLFEMYQSPVVDDDRYCDCCYCCECCCGGCGLCFKHTSLLWQVCNLILRLPPNLVLVPAFVGIVLVLELRDHSVIPKGLVHSFKQDLQFPVNRRITGTHRMFLRHATSGCSSCLSHTTHTPRDPFEMHVATSRK